MSRLLSAVFTVASITLAVANTARAQLPNQGNPSVLEAVQRVQSSVDALASQLDAIATPPAVISTGLAVRPDGKVAACFVQNVATSPVTVTLELRTRTGGLKVSDIDRGLPPGEGFAVIDFSSGTQGFWCRFVMVSGSSADIRGNLVISEPFTEVELIVREAR